MADYFQEQDDARADEGIPTWGEHNLHQRIKKRQAAPNNAENNPKNLPLSAVSANPPSSLEEEMDKVLKDLQTSWLWQSVNLPKGKTVLDPPREEALSQLKQLILKDMLEMIKELENHREYIYWGDGSPSDLDNKLTELRQSARKRYQS